MQKLILAVTLALSALITQAANAQVPDQYNLIHFDVWTQNAWVVDMTDGGDYMQYSFVTCVGLMTDFQSGVSDPTGQGQPVQAACSRATDDNGTLVADWHCKGMDAFDSLEELGLSAGSAAYFLNVANMYGSLAICDNGGANGYYQRLVNYSGGAGGI